MEQQLRRLLDELSAAIGRTKDHEEREELTRLHGAVEQHLEGNGTATDDGEDGSDDRRGGEHAGLVDAFEKAEIRFESGHPSLAESLRQAIQSLSSAGL